MSDDVFLRISGCVSDSIVDGPGMRFVVFVQGCPHLCPGCHNPETHDFSGGKLADPQTIVDTVRKDPLVRGVTFSGGEPFCQAKVLCEIGKQIAALGKDIVVYTGYTLDQLLVMGKKDRSIVELLRLADWIVDGRFEETEKDLTLSFRGSRNQRLIARDEISIALSHIFPDTYPN